jgi:hypothetical protein
MTNAVTLGISGWFTAHGTLYHEEGRRLDEITPEDWFNLVAHADAIARIFHLTITAGERSRELAINDPFEAPELALLIRLARRAMRDRLVQRVEAMDGETLAALRAVSTR